MKTSFQRRAVKVTALALIAPLLLSCQQPSDKVVIKPAPEQDMSVSHPNGKPIVYQMFTRLFGNKNTTNKPWGSLEENGVGKFSDINDNALSALKSMGVTHVWYTGIVHHASVTDYSAYGIPVDDPDVVKGRAGSPYAVRDYYNVNPDLADDPAQRLAEFEALVERTRAKGMRVIIDIVPNHVARRYASLTFPETSFGLHDNTDVAYHKDNNFYYVPGQAFEVPDIPENLTPLGGEPHALADGKFDENPAKWTGNGARAAKPDVNDWYETVKINYGVRPDGTFDFPALPYALRGKAASQHVAFWQDKDVPDSWVKFKDITQYWLDKGVDGFRYDMAEMVPVAFWSYLNSHIKIRRPDAFLLAEVYQPHLYRDYLQLGLMDSLYDKVDFYDTLKRIMQGTGATSELVTIQQQYQDIAPQLLHFLENHDEQRIASPDFAGDAEKGKPALVVSALMSASPMMLYFGQEVGEDGSEDMGFGDPTRTTIFDYAGVPAHQRWMNNGKFDGGQLTDAEKALRHYYETVMHIAAIHPAAMGDYVSLHQSSLSGESDYSEKQLAFARWQGEDKLIVVSNFDAENTVSLNIVLPPPLQQSWAVNSPLELTDLLTGRTLTSIYTDQQAAVALSLPPLGSAVLSVTKQTSK
ncbi:alpha-amylase family glycosyl hydrolase [Marisediminitalea aggregata]|uniref:alpha-amylase family glycosyl hydrolase n=1 Tax=Marisediminitalea aggregata TaxID=634436 RepID=UPI00359FA91F